MARLSKLDSARRRRDLGLARARRLTTYSAIGATAFTGVFAIAAATSIPGRSATTSPATQTGDSSGSTSPGLSAPAQQPQNAYGGAPVVISGGS